MSFPVRMVAFVASFLIVAAGGVLIGRWIDGQDVWGPKALCEIQQMTECELTPNGWQPVYERGVGHVDD